jgi:hypothetical protein
VEPATTVKPNAQQPDVIVRVESDMDLLGGQLKSAIDRSLFDVPKGLC